MFSFHSHSDFFHRSVFQLLVKKRKTNWERSKFELWGQVYSSFTGQKQKREERRASKRASSKFSFRLGLAGLVVKSSPLFCQIWTVSVEASISQSRPDSFVSAAAGHSARSDCTICPSAGSSVGTCTRVSSGRAALRAPFSSHEFFQTNHSFCPS